MSVPMPMCRPRRVCVFCGTCPGTRAAYASAARALGRELVARGIGLVYGGGRTGLMGVLADTMLAGAGEVIGVIPRFLMDKNAHHRGVKDMRVVDSMHIRKATMTDLADAFIALPGGLGTLDELFEALTWGQLELHRKPCGLLNVEGYFDALIAFLDSAVSAGFIPSEHRKLAVVHAEPAGLLDRLARHVPPDAGGAWWDALVE